VREHRATAVEALPHARAGLEEEEEGEVIGPRGAGLEEGAVEREAVEVEEIRAGAGTGRTRAGRRCKGTRSQAMLPQYFQVTTYSVSDTYRILILHGCSRDTYPPRRTGP
jgi:hypothetical protein